MTDEELNRLLDTQAEVFNQNILAETKEAQDRLMERHDDYIKMEKSFVQLNTLFQVSRIRVGQAHIHYWTNIKQR